MAERTIDINRVYSRDEVAAILGVNPATVSHYRRTRKLPIRKGRGGTITGAKLLQWHDRQAK